MGLTGEPTSTLSLLQKPSLLQALCNVCMGLYTSSLQTLVLVVTLADQSPLFVGS